MLVRKTRHHPGHAAPCHSSEHALKHPTRVLLLCCALLLAPAAPAAFAAPRASVPCWKRLLNDWYDGTINNIYPLRCYQEAINHLPVDVRVYSSARDDILAAEQAAANHQHAPREKSPPPSSSTPASTGSSTTPASTGTTTSASTTPPPATTSTSSVAPTQTTTTPTTTDASPPKKKHGIAGLLADITPGDPQSFPLPLLVLGALAILLVVAGAAGMVWQRAHPRDGE